MPSARKELQDKFPGMDAEAMEALKDNFFESDFVFRRNDVNYKPTPREMEALDYLFEEWDYGYAADYL